MKKFTMIVILVGLFLGLCANSNCDSQDGVIYLSQQTVQLSQQPIPCNDADLDGYCQVEDFWPGYDDDGEVQATNDDEDGYAIVNLDDQSQLEVSLVTDETMISTYNGVYQSDYNVAVMAIHLQPYQDVNWQMVESASLDIFLLNYDEFKAPGPEYICPTSGIYASFKAAKDLSGLTETSCDCTDFPICEPFGCNSPNYLGGNLKVLNFQDLGDGWFEISSPDLAALMAQASQESQAYLVLDINSRCTNGYPFGGMKPLEIEDAGNHGSSGNVSVISFQFNRGHDFYRDRDGDGYGSEKHSAFSYFPPDGYVPVTGDCNDHDPQINPSVTEIPDNKVDENCDGLMAYEQYSLDEYDGYNFGGRYFGGAAVDDLLISTFSITSLSHMTGFMTFDAQDIKMSRVKALGVEVFPLVAECDYGQPSLSLTLVDTGNIYDWGGQNCSASWIPGVNGVEYTLLPEGCIMPPSFRNLKTWPLSKQNNGWYNTGSNEEIFQYISQYLNQFQDARYFTFNLNIHCDTTYGLLNDGYAEFEDGGNHGGTGNLPTLIVSY